VEGNKRPKWKNLPSVATSVGSFSFVSRMISDDKKGKNNVVRKRAE
jgi:hypothetical protein